MYLIHSRIFHSIQLLKLLESLDVQCAQLVRQILDGDLDSAALETLEYGVNISRAVLTDLFLRVGGAPATGSSRNGETPDELWPYLAPKPDIVFKWLVEEEGARPREARVPVPYVPPL